MNGVERSEGVHGGGCGGGRGCQRRGRALLLLDPRRSKRLGIRKLVATLYQLVGITLPRPNHLISWLETSKLVVRSARNSPPSLQRCLAAVYTFKPNHFRLCLESAQIRFMQLTLSWFARAIHPFLVAARQKSDSFHARYRFDVVHLRICLILVRLSPLHRLFSVSTLRLIHFRFN